jgi:CIC family chloride channel protein
LTRGDLEKAMAAGKTEQRLEALVDSEHIPHVHRDHPLHLALERMSKTQLDLLPVIHRADAHKLEGVVTLRDVLEAYGVQNTDAAQL